MALRIQTTIGQVVVDYILEPAKRAGRFGRFGCPPAARAPDRIRTMKKRVK